MDRRTFLTISATGGIAAAMPVRANEKRPVTIATTNPGIDRARASFLLKQAGLDAIIVGRPENIFYATGNRPLTTRLGFADTAFAIIPAHEKSPIIYVLPQFAYYFTTVDPGLSDGVLPYLVTGKNDDEIAGASYFANPLDNQLPLREARRRQATSAAGPFFGSTRSAVTAACDNLGIDQYKLGFDCMEAGMTIESTFETTRVQRTEYVIKSLRLIKTDWEIALMSAASSANVAAAQKTARQIRTLGTIKNVRNYFNAEVSRLGNLPGFMVVNGAIDEAYDEEFVDGTSILIDCVSSLQGYHGDYGRTIFMGEPLEPMATKVKTTGLAWNELRGQLKPGMRFSEIRTTGTDIVTKMGQSLNVPFNPHCVGLAHTEQPMVDQNGAPIDTMLEPGMIISVDCPLMEATTQGTAHLEDLTLITKDGCIPIHDVSNPTIIV
ncbi:MAG: M24 family metallopeptidase [Parasphingorhabdus sp.]|uniref:M24 family metallopeptidase n=1 Tax=Parasphingorhabdus sp. TaxID=2709688 RepID=UPI003299DC8D